MTLKNETHILYYSHSKHPKFSMFPSKWICYSIYLNGSQICFILKMYYYIIIYHNYETSPDKLFHETSNTFNNLFVLNYLNRLFPP